ncbi:hypothetical protein MMC25_004648 [Agyrium rufum]|nr:hypothetical protein [Agyrium rufum]
MQPITIYWRDIVPNPAKVVVILEELGLPYVGKYLELPELKSEPFVTLNPNGRIPAIEDPNTGIKLWESGAIVRYLIETYDKDKKITYESAPEKYYVEQWAFFQASGQGPYFGQAAWFNAFHPEKLPSAQERNGNELKRVVGVLDGYLKGKDWLVGDKCTYADLAFVMWNACIPFVMGAGPVEFKVEEFPDFTHWQNAMLSRPSVQQVMSKWRSKDIKSEGIQ